MLGCADAKELLPPAQLRLIAAVVKKALHQYEIQPPRFQLPQQNLGIVHQQGERGIRLGPQEMLDLRGDDEFPDGFGSPHPQGERDRCRHRRFHFLAVVGHGPGELPQTQAGLRQAEHLSLIGEKPAAIVVFQVVDVVSHRGLGQTQLLRRPGIIHRLAHSKERIPSRIQHSISPIT